MTLKYCQHIRELRPPKGSVVGIGTPSQRWKNIDKSLAAGVVNQPWELKHNNIYTAINCHISILYKI